MYRNQTPFLVINKTTNIMQNKKKDYYSFDFNILGFHTIEDVALNEWYDLYMNDGIDRRHGYTKGEIIHALNFFKTKEVVLSLEAEMWIAKNT